MSPERPSKSEFPIGARFTMSPLGAARHSSHASKEGTIIGSGRYCSTARVQFDGHKTPTSLHRDYIEIVAAQAEPTQDCGE
jgi:hypothetical protein